MKYCTACGNQIGDNATSCPKCGEPCNRPSNIQYGSKDKTTAAILALFLGGLGAHHFYLGKTFIGILYLLLCFTFVPALLGLVEGLNYLTMGKNTFNKRYNRVEGE
jgi:TM2 domain-containing membrane protein YozV